VTRRRGFHDPSTAFAIALTVSFAVAPSRHR
jgi:hypothetical protein